MTRREARRHDDEEQDDRNEEDPEMGGPGFTARWDRLTSWEDVYGISLALLLTALLLPVFMNSGPALTAVTALTALAACLIALHSSALTPSILWATTGALVLAAMGVGVDQMSDTDRFATLIAGAVGLLLIATPVAVLSRIARHKTITPRTLYGALCVYLLFGLAFSFFYQAMDSNDPASFPAIDSNHDRGTYGYYSFVTMTTTGYGDIVPVTPSARSLAVFEVVLGQVFLVVIVARVVSMLGRERNPSSHPIARRLQRAESTEPPPEGADA